MRILFRWVVVTIAILILPYLLPGASVESVGSALAAAMVLGIFNVILRPILIILTLPITVFTLGLFLIVINGIVLYFVGGIVSGVEFEGLGTAMLGSLIISFVSWLTQVKYDGHRRVVVIQNDGFKGGSRKMRDLN